jgi:hypothetical protein
VRVDRPPHYDTFAEFQYSYHYGDSYIPHLQQEEPLNLACRHFIDCIETNCAPLTGGRQGLDMVRILEGASASLKMSGAPFVFSTGNGSSPVAARRNGSSQSVPAGKRPKVPSLGKNRAAALLQRT